MPDPRRLLPQVLQPSPSSTVTRLHQCWSSDMKSWPSPGGPGGGYYRRGARLRMRRVVKVALVLTGTLLGSTTLLAPVSGAAVLPLGKADKVIVVKSERRLYLVRD